MLVGITDLMDRLVDLVVSLSSFSFLLDGLADSSMLLQTAEFNRSYPLSLYQLLPYFSKSPSLSLRLDRFLYFASSTLTPPSRLSTPSPRRRSQQQSRNSINQHSSNFVVWRQFFLFRLPSFPPLFFGHRFFPLL